MKINMINKTLLATFLTVALASCTNSNAPEKTVENSTENSEISQENLENSAEVKNTENNDGIVSEESQENPSETEKPKENDKARENDKTVINIKKQNNDDSKEASETQKTKENIVNEEDKDATKVDDNMNYQQNDGIYLSTLLASKSGNREAETGIPFVSNIKLDEETLTVEASLDYRKNPENTDEAAEELDNGTYNFKLSPDVTFQAVGGLAEPEYYSKEEFIKLYEEVKESGLGLRLEVVDGLVTVVSIAS